MSRLLILLSMCSMVVSPLASASMILSPPGELLAREADKPEPSPAFGPKFHFIRGPELIAYPRQREQDSIPALSFCTGCLLLSVGLFVSIPRWQRIMILLKLLD